MKKYIYLFCCITAPILFSACSDNDTSSDSNVIGTWELIEILSDPGDGSGVFMDVDSEKTVTFESDGTVNSNGDLGSNSSALSGGPTSGTYDLVEGNEDQIEGTIDIDDIDFARISSFTVDGNELIINYLCIEPCRAKYNRR